MAEPRKVFVAFGGDELLGRGSLQELATRCRARLDRGDPGRIAIYEDDTGRIVELDLAADTPDFPQGLDRDAAAEAADPSAPRRTGPGRPKLGVVSREVSLLPRHWRWLSEQRVGASATLRRLVEAAMKSESGEAVVRRTIDAAHRFMWDIAGDRPGFEEASRALFAADFARFEALVAEWPAGIRDQLARYVQRAQEARARGGPADR